MSSNLPISSSPSSDLRQLHDLQIGSYSSAELGLPTLVADLLDSPTIYVDYLDATEYSDANMARMRYFDLEARGHERERIWFELQVESVVSKTIATSEQSDLLSAAFNESLMECSEELGYDGLDLSDNSNIYVERSLLKYGLQLDEYRQLLNVCSQRAASYPTLDVTEKSIILGGLSAKIADAISEAYSDTPELAIPLEHHDGMFHPLEEYWTTVCGAMESPEAREECAEWNRVDLSSR